MKKLNTYILEKLVIDKDVNLDNNHLLIKVLKDFTKSDLTPEFIKFVNDWVKKNNINRYYFVIFKGKRAYNKLSPEIIEKIDVTACTKDDEWNECLPEAWNGGHDPDYWVYEDLPDFIVCGNKECMMIVYDNGNGADIKLIVKKKEDWMK